MDPLWRDLEAVPDGAAIELTGYLAPTPDGASPRHGLLVPDPGCCAGCPPDPAACVELLAVAALPARTGTLRVAGTWRRLPPDALWSVCALGAAQLPLNAYCILAGGHVRTGLEDNLFYRRGERATNAMLVERVVRLAGELERPVATPEQARELLGIAAAA